MNYYGIKKLEKRVMQNYIRNLAQVSLGDVALVGGKTASLGEMIQALEKYGIAVPGGFAITSEGYRAFIDYNNLEERIEDQLKHIADFSDVARLHSIGEHIRSLLLNAELPAELINQITEAYQVLSQESSSQACAVAVRSSATAEDLPTASFAGQQESFLNITGIPALLQACKQCFASLFTDRAIVYRIEQGFKSMDVALSICVQKMIESAVSGVVFTLDTESGFSDVISITASYGLGEGVVQGIVNPDEYLLYKKELRAGTHAIIKKYVGLKQTQVIYNTSEGGTRVVPVKEDLQNVFALSDSAIQELARSALVIEKYYSEKHGSWMPMDIEWALNAHDNKLYIIQARPETIYGSQANKKQFSYFTRVSGVQANTIITGQSVGRGVATGKVRILNRREDLAQFKKGEILVSRMTDPDWVVVMKQAAGIITDVGGRTCHAAIVSRELGVPAIIGTHNATSTLHDGQEVTLDCSQGSTGFVYAGVVPFTNALVEMKEQVKMPCDILINIADPENAFMVSQLPVAGVGLARLEFIINNYIGIHPMAVAKFDTITDESVKHKIMQRMRGYPTAVDFFVDTLAQAISMIAAAFYPRPVIIRLTDFKSNEYRNLLGGTLFEPVEENPMIGWRGAVRYTSPEYAPAFALECAAIKKAREHMGFSNIKLMVPFVRTVAEAQATIDLLAQHGLVRGSAGLELFMMVEIPSNIVLLEKFMPLFDGFSIGSNDLTQLTLGVDRDSGLLQNLFNENDESVRTMIIMALKKAKTEGKYIGICGQAPSDYPEFAQFLIDNGISSLSLTPDAVLPFLMRYAQN